jgi:hypothetical protein
MLKHSPRLAAALLVTTLALGLAVAPVNGQNADDFELTMEFSCDEDLNVVLNFTFTNNSTDTVEVFNPHIGGGGPTLPFSPLTLAPGASSTAVWPTGENPYTDSFTVDMPMMINNEEFQTFYDFVVENETCVPETTTSTTTTIASTTTTAPAPPAPVTPATPTYTG